MMLDTIELPDDLEWSDEFDYSEVTQDVQYGTSGSVFIQESMKQKGRPITMVGQEDMSWLTRETLLLLQSLANVADHTMTLTLSDARTFNVRFRHGDKGVDVTGVKGYGGIITGAYFKVNAIRLMEV